jgi:pimeloyl-[acyl-carrier protein] methyl ester esterase
MELLRSMFYPPPSDGDLAWMFAEILKTPTDVAVSTFRAVSTADLVPVLGGLRTPTLVVNGRQSIVPPGVGQWTAERLANGRAVVLDDAGHAPFWDAAPAFNELVRGVTGRR